MILPFILMVLTMAGLAAGTLTTVSMLTVRGSRQHEQRVRTYWAMEEGMALAMQAWSSSLLAVREPGDIAVATFSSAAGPAVRVTSTRMHPLVAQVSVAVGGHQQRTWVWLAPPPFPVVPGVHIYAADDSLSPVGSAIATITRRAQVLPPSEARIASFRSFFRGSATEWYAGADAFAGLAILHGALELRTVRRLNGLLIVHGTIRCLGGLLVGQGSVVVVPERGSAPPPMPCLEVQPDREALEYALAFVAVPQRAPFHLRHWTVDERF